MFIFSVQGVFRERRKSFSRVLRLSLQRRNSYRRHTGRDDFVQTVTCSQYWSEEFRLDQPRSIYPDIDRNDTEPKQTVDRFVSYVKERTASPWARQQMFVFSKERMLSFPFLLHERKGTNADVWCSWRVGTTNGCKLIEEKNFDCKPSVNVRDGIESIDVRKTGNESGGWREKENTKENNFMQSWFTLKRLRSLELHHYDETLIFSVRRIPNSLISFFPPMTFLCTSANEVTAVHAFIIFSFSICRHWQASISAKPSSHHDCLLLCWTEKESGRWHWMIAETSSGVMYVAKWFIFLWGRLAYIEKARERENDRIWTRFILD